jgi:hypothetical protein
LWSVIAKGARCLFGWPCSKVRAPIARLIVLWSEVLSPRAKVPRKWNRLLGKRLTDVTNAASVAALPQELTAIP